MGLCGRSWGQLCPTLAVLTSICVRLSAPSPTGRSQAFLFFGRQSLLLRSLSPQEQWVSRSIFIIFGRPLTQRGLPRWQWRFVSSTSCCSIEESQRSVQYPSVFGYSSPERLCGSSWAERSTYLPL